MFSSISALSSQRTSVGWTSVCVALGRRFWIRYTSERRVRVIDCLQARTPPDAFRLEVPVPRQHPQSKTTIRVTYVPILSHLPLHLPLPHSLTLPSYKPRTNSRPFYIPCLFPKRSPPRAPSHPLNAHSPIHYSLNIRPTHSPHPATTPRTSHFTYL